MLNNKKYLLINKIEHCRNSIQESYCTCYVEWRKGWLGEDRKCDHCHNTKHLN